MRNISFLFVNSIFYITFAAMKLSVIIPVYRVEATLNRCLESVLAQNVEDMEVILVDDGSPDNSPVMCDEWAVKDVRICVIHKINGGLSDARNAGLDIAKGEYVTFVDSDDYLLPDTYGPLLNMIGTCDIIEFSVADRLTLQDCCYDDMSKYWLESQAYSHAYAWNKIYRRSLFDGIYFPKGEIFEDVIMLPKLLRQAQRVMTTSKGFYCYHCNNRWRWTDSPARCAFTFRNACGRCVLYVFSQHTDGHLGMHKRAIHTKKKKSKNYWIEI